MRLLTIAGLMVGLLTALPAQAQDAKKDKTTISEIGGKTLEQWIKEINHKDPGRRATAINMVLMFGPERAYQALPAILEQIGKATFLDVSVRVNGATALGLIIGSASDPEPKHVREAIRILNKLATDTQAIVKYRAVQALGRIGEEARDSVPIVIPLLRDNLACETRQAAAIALGQIALDKDKGAPTNVISALFEALRDPAAQVRLAAIQSLTWLGAPADPKARDNMVRALEPLASKDLEPTVRIWAHMAVMSTLHMVTPERIAPIIGFLDHEDSSVRVQAAQALGTIGPRAKSAIPGLINRLTDRDPSVIMVSIWALGRMEDNATIAVPRLEKLSADKDQPEAIQKAAEEAIKQIKDGKKK